MRVVSIIYSCFLILCSCGSANYEVAYMEEVHFADSTMMQLQPDFEKDEVQTVIDDYSMRLNSITDTLNDIMMKLEAIEEICTKNKNEQDVR